MPTATKVPATFPGESKNPLDVLALGLEEVELLEVGMLTTVETTCVVVTRVAEPVTVITE